MSVKRIITALLAIILVGGFIWLGAMSLIKAQDEKLKIDQELHNRSIEVKKLENKEEELEQQRIKAEQEKTLHEQQLQQSQKQQEELIEKQKQLEAQLQAKLDNKNKIALASAKKSETASSVVSGADTTTILQLIRDASAKYGVSYEMMVKIAKCESTLGKNLRNPNPVVIAGVNYGHAEGIFQFIPSTWTRMSREAGFYNSSVYDAYANVNTAAHAFSTGKRGEWEC